MWLDPHDWLYHHAVGGVQTVQCRRCGKWDSYRLTGYKPQPPRSECVPKPTRLIVIEVPT